MVAFRVLTAGLDVDGSRAHIRGVGLRGPVPAELRQGAFTLADARRAGLRDRDLRTKRFRRVGPRTYVWADAPDDPFRLLVATAARLPAEAAFAGRAAAWLLGADVRPDNPIDISLPEWHVVAGRAGVRFHRAELRGSDVGVYRGLRATHATRIVADVANWEPLVEAVVVTDSLLHAGAVTLPTLEVAVAARAGRWGVARFRRVVGLCEPLAESPMETRLRLLLVLARLPRPTAQAKLNDRRGRLLGRVDLYYPEVRLALEYDGSAHRTRVAEDNRRQNALVNAGYRILRFTAGDVLGNPAGVVDAVRTALKSGGFPGNRHATAA